ncbi:hypothetical protein C2845_PM15G03530 [Panicum miliaceum]|uniref:Transposase (putative) gypsy type domain-containing protein n=1 Tax=Panicum miliaceum TaxID=4540 RepID=A0A3L6Q725_PANMI|nr:hypothetical protein C2845_PM15G03530 [Panicum miliaceum]
MTHWHQSNVNELLLEDFAAKGFLPPKEAAGWRAPPPEHKEPHPEPHEVVSFLAFHERLLGYYAHWFLRVLLHEWRLELQHLNPNEVLHIAGFVTLCEAFLGNEPHVGLFRAFFYGKISPAKGATSSATPVGGFSLQRRPHHDDVYPEYTTAESNKGWHGDRFYIRNPSEASFPDFHGEWQVRDLSWTWGTLTPEKTLVAAIKDVIRGRMVKAGLNGATLFFSMRERLVMPLAERRKSLWLYSGPSDPDRAFTEALPEDDVYSWLMMVLKGADQEEFRALAPFDWAQPPVLSSSSTWRPRGQGKERTQEWREAEAFQRTEELVQELDSARSAEGRDRKHAVATEQQLSTTRLALEEERAARESAKKHSQAQAREVISLKERVQVLEAAVEESKQRNEILQDKLSRSEEVLLTTESRLAASQQVEIKRLAAMALSQERERTLEGETGRLEKAANNLMAELNMLQDAARGVVADVLGEVSRLIAEGVFHGASGVLTPVATHFPDIDFEVVGDGEYRDKFTQLSRYAPHEVDSDAKRQERFLEGLIGPLNYQLHSHTFPNFQTLLDKAIGLESKRKELGNTSENFSPRDNPAATPDPATTHPKDISRALEDKVEDISRVNRINELHSSLNVTTSRLSATPTRNRTT